MQHNDASRTGDKIEETRSRTGSPTRFDGSKIEASTGGAIDYGTQTEAMQLAKKFSIEALSGIKDTADAHQQYGGQSDKKLSHEEYYQQNTITGFSDIEVISFKTVIGREIKGVNWRQDRALRPYLQEYNNPTGLIHKEREFLKEEGLLDSVTVVRPIDPRYDCHSLTTTDGQTGRLDDRSMEIILMQNCDFVESANSYRNDHSVAQKFKQGDYVIYRSDPPARDIKHSGWIDSVENDGKDIYVISKWGTGSTFRHKIGDVPSDYKISDNSAMWQVWNNPNGRLLQTKAIKEDT